MEVEHLFSPLSTLPDSSSQLFDSDKIIHSSPVRPNEDNQPTFHRQVKLLPYELREHCMIYFEEGLCGSLTVSALAKCADRRYRLPSVKSSDILTWVRVCLLVTDTHHPTTATSHCPHSYFSRSSNLDYTCEVLRPDSGLKSCPPIPTVGV